MMMPILKNKMFKTNCKIITINLKEAWTIKKIKFNYSRIRNQIIRCK